MTAKQKLFGFGEVLGQRIKVNDQWLTVIGVLADANVEKQEFEGVKIQNPNNDIYLPITTSLKKFDRDPLDNELHEVVVQVAPRADLRDQAAAISNLLSTMHRFVDDYSLIVPEKLLEQNQKTQGIFNIVMGAIASISLLVGGIGIMNIMLASVLERTTEIGLRRAIGARKRDIRVQFIAEALGLSLAGGLVGIALGFAHFTWGGDLFRLEHDNHGGVDWAVIRRQLACGVNLRHLSCSPGLQSRSHRVPAVRVVDQNPEIGVASVYDRETFPEPPAGRRST